MFWDNNWQPDYGNASRPGLLSDGSAVQTYDISTMKDEFRVPRIDQIPRGRRNQLLRKFFWQEFAKKYIEELSKPEITELDIPASHYKETFNCGGFNVRDNLLENLTEEERIQLEEDTKIPMNTYYLMIDELKASRVSHNPFTIFRRTSKFSKPWYAPLE